MGKKKEDKKENDIKQLQYLVRNPIFLKDRKNAIYPFPSTSKSPEGYLYSLYPKTPGKGFSIIKISEFLEKYKLTVFPDDELLKDSMEPLEYLASEGECFENGWTVKVMPVENYRPIKDEDGCLTYSSGMFIEDGRYLTLKLDLTKPDIEIKVKRLIRECSKYIIKPNTRNKAATKFDELIAWDEYKVLRNFSKIAQKHKIDESTVRKAYYRAFERIMGEKYDVSKHNRKILTIEQVEKTCDKCPEHPDNGGGCDTLCPSALAYIEQDSKPMFSVTKTAEHIKSSEKTDSYLREKELLDLIGGIINRKISSIDEIEDLSETEKKHLKAHPFIKALLTN